MKRFQLLILALAAFATLQAGADYDVYLLIGQSNCAGRGPMISSDTTDVIPGVYLLNNKGKVEEAIAPLNRYSNIRKDMKVQGIGLGMGFGDKMHRWTNRKVLLVQNARGGSSVRSWTPGAADGYADSAIVRARQALRFGRLKAIVWHQGETDTQMGMTTGEYVERFAKLIAYLRENLNAPDVPVVVGEIGQWEWTPMRDINRFNDTTLVEVCKAVPNCSKVSSDRLPRRFRDKPRDPHFSRQAGIELGERYAREVLPKVSSAYIAPYRDNKRAAISFTYDDGLMEHYTMVAPELEKRGFRGTFWVIGNMVGVNDTVSPRLTWDKVREMHERGHEMSSHSWSHPHLTRLSKDSLLREILMNDSAIERATGAVPRTFCYPYNESNDLVLKLTRNGRVGTRTHQVGHGQQNSKTTPDKLSAWLRDVIDQGEWGVTMTHGITRGYDKWYHPEVLWNFYDEVKAREDSLWVATFAEVAAYRTERDNTLLKVSCGHRGMTVKAKYYADKRLFHELLTLVFTLPDNVGDVRATQGGKPLTVIRQGNTARLNFEPWGKKVKIKW